MKQKLSNIFFFLVCFASQIKAQINLVPNPSFEDTIGCPNNAAELYQTKYWRTASFCSPDFYSKCSSDWWSSVPYNIGGNQKPLTGNCYVGIAVATPREYFFIRLKDTLIKNHIYNGGYYLSRADTVEDAIATMGLFLSSDTLVDSLKYYLQVNPQIENPYSNVLFDSINWIKLNGTFKAKGGEKYLFVGNFKPDSTCNKVFVKNSWVGGVAYYYIDSVFLFDVTNSLVSNILNESINIYPNPFNNNISIVNNVIGSTFQLFDVNGLLVLKRRVFKKDEVIDLTILPNGIYYVLILNNEKVVFKKTIIKQ